MAIFLLSSALNYLDRVLVGNLVVTLTKQFSLSASQFANQALIFSLVYAATTPLMGLLIDRLGLLRASVVAVGEGKGLRGDFRLDPCAVEPLVEQLVAVAVEVEQAEGQQPQRDQVHREQACGQRNRRHGIACGTHQLGAGGGFAHRAGSAFGKGIARAVERVDRGEIGLAVARLQEVALRHGDRSFLRPRFAGRRE